MKYGLIGEHLGHSFSRDIHKRFRDYDYELCEVSRENFDSFMTKRDFLAINVTIPYKELVIPYLYYIDDTAKMIGAVNTVVNKDGRLYGYNTDFYGMKMLIEKAKISLYEKKVAIIGTGGTSKTALAVAKSCGAGLTVRVSRSKSEDTVTYSELYENYSDTEVIINTTPLGMFPNNYSTPIDISKFPNLSGVIDAVYNPLRTMLITEAKKKKITAEGGLYMLVAQAVKASEYFLSDRVSEKTLEKVYNDIRKEKESIVLIGMPASGKSTVGSLVAKKLGKRFIDTDAMIVNRAKKPITEIFAESGEAYFRELEAEIILEASKEVGAVIATGGGAILREENVKALRTNGRIYFIDRPLENLVPTSSRPLSSDRASIELRYKERYDKYCASADIRIDASGTPENVCNEITEDFSK